MKRNRDRSVKGEKSHIYYPDGSTEELITIWKAPFPWRDPVDIPENKIEKS